MNKTQLRYCDICGKTINTTNKSKHLISNKRKHKKEYGIVVRECEIFKPKIDEIDYILDNVTKDCGDK